MTEPTGTTSPAAVAARTAALVSAMTLEEKLGCLDGDIDAWPGLFEMMAGGYHARTFPAAAVPRLGFAGFSFSDGPRGCVIGSKTCFPVSMARGATWDVDLEHRIGKAIGAEARAEGATLFGGVCVNLLRHPGWGRAQETYGEEPYHVGEMGRALALGAQEHLMACVKHFACNSMENARFRVDVAADERALHEVYLPHFRRIVTSGVAVVMSAYNSLNGHFCGENAALLDEILRGEWGFEGFTISDFIFGLRDPVASVLAGLDVEMPFRQQRAEHLAAAVADGRLPLAAVDDAVGRIVGTVLRFAEVLSRPVDTTAVAGPAHRALAREAATSAITLLHNDGVLPIDEATVGRVAVVGRLAAIANLGDRGSSEVLVDDAVTILDGLRCALGADRVVQHDHDPAVASGADVAVVVVGSTWRDEGEFIDGSGTAGLMADHFPSMTDADRAAIAAGPTHPPARTSRPDAGFGAGGDRRSIRLSADDAALVHAVAAVNPRTVVLLMGGSAVLPSGWLEAAAAVALVWYPGMEGGHAVADVLLGRVDPSGRLPFSIPTDEDHLPSWEPDADAVVYDSWHGHWKLTRDGNRPAFPFGFGLSYSTFTLTHASHESDQVAVTVANIGTRDGITVVQVYGGLPGSAWERPAERLVGFARVAVPAGQAVDVRIPVAWDQLAVRQAGRWVNEPGRYRLAVARHAGDPAARILHVDR
jgi:beta-glucosidase